MGTRKVSLGSSSRKDGAVLFRRAGERAEEEGGRGRGQERSKVGIYSRREGLAAVWFHEDSIEERGKIGRLRMVRRERGRGKLVRKNVLAFVLLLV